MSVGTRHVITFLLNVKSQVVGKKQILFLFMVSIKVTSFQSKFL